MIFKKLKVKMCILSKRNSFILLLKYLVKKHKNNSIIQLICRNYKYSLDFSVLI